LRRSWLSIFAGKHAQKKRHRMTITAAWNLDASVATNWNLRDEQLLDQADQVLNLFGEGAIGLAAPTYLLDEAGNILRTAVRPFFERIVVAFPTRSSLDDL
jgi:hypothetical protein